MERGGIHKGKRRKAPFALAILRGGRDGLAAMALESESYVGAQALALLGRAAGTCGALGRGTDVVADRMHATRGSGVVRGARHGSRAPHQGRLAGQAV